MTGFLEKMGYEEIAEIVSVDGNIIRVRYETLGVSDVDMTPLMEKANPTSFVSRTLRDREVFGAVRLEHGVLTWENEGSIMDIAPERIYSMAVPVE